MWVVIWLCLLGLIVRADKTNVWFSQRRKVNQCIVVFVVSPHGVNGTMERGTCICPKYQDPRVDLNGHGTWMLKNVYQYFSPCTLVVPVRFVQPTLVKWHLVTQWIHRECMRRKRLHHCAILTHMNYTGVKSRIPIFRSAYVLAEHIGDFKVTHISNDGLIHRKYGGGGSS